MGPVEEAIRAAIEPGVTLKTRAQGKPFVVSELRDDAIVLLLGAQKAATAIRWTCLEGVPGYLAHRDWIVIGSLYDTGAAPNTFDAYMKTCGSRATAGWVAVVLERAGLVELGGKPLKIRLRA